MLKLDGSFHRENVHTTCSLDILFGISESPFIFSLEVTCGMPGFFFSFFVFTCMCVRVCVSEPKGCVRNCESVLCAAMLQGQQHTAARQRCDSDGSVAPGHSLEA